MNDLVRRAIRVNVVVDDDNRSWVIEKMGRRLIDHAAKFGVEAAMSSAPRPDVDLNHWMSYAFANVKHATPTTMFVTHIDDPFKLRLVKDEVESGVDLGICMSSYAVEQLVAGGVPRQSLTYVLPGLDFAAEPRRIVIGLTTRIYPDGRKREKLLVQLAQTTRLDAFRFDIFGMNWEKVIPALEKAGAEVRYFRDSDDFVADYHEMIKAIPLFDYYLYLGWDEGSLGTVDALAAGIRTIVTPQGFHVDLVKGITHAVADFDDLLAVFRELAADRESRIASVRGLTWEEHTRQHAVMWRAVLSGCKEEINVLLGRPGKGQRPSVPAEERRRFYLRALSPVRLRSALSHIPLLKPLRRKIKSLARGPVQNSRP